MKPIYYTFLAAAITITSCKNKDEETAKSTSKVITPFTQQTAAVTQTEQQSAGAAQHNLFHENNTTGTPSVAGGVNPAHGQPNHRCDIAVGAPLNSQASGKPAAPQTSQMQMPQMQTITQTAATKTVTPKGMNPPHGQPNHRCDIAVGAPLNSKPAAAATTTATPAPATPAPASGEISKNITVQPPVPALLSTSSANTETAEGMNPAHGQAGHRCDIAVGAPLPKS